jgi:hypothetical protein
MMQITAYATTTDQKRLSPADVMYRASPTPTAGAQMSVSVVLRLAE